MMKNVVVLIIAFLVFIFISIMSSCLILAGCSSIKDKVHKMTAPDTVESQKTDDQAEEGTTQTKVEKSKKENKKAKNKKDEGNFISAAGLSDTEIDALWAVAVDGCYDLNYSVTYNDRKTRNLACQTQTQGGESTYTMRVRFSSEGILIDVKSNSMANMLFGNVATKQDTQKMKALLEEKLKDMRGGKKNRQK